MNEICTLYRIKNQVWNKKKIQMIFNFGKHTLRHLTRREDVFMIQRLEPFPQICPINREKRPFLKKLVGTHLYNIWTPLALKLVIGKRKKSDNFQNVWNLKCSWTEFRWTSFAETILTSCTFLSNGNVERHTPRKNCRFDRYSLFFKFREAWNWIKMPQIKIEYTYIQIWYSLKGFAYIYCVCFQDQ